MRASVMHLKPYWKVQKKEGPLEVSRDTLRTPMSQQETVNDEKDKASHMKPALFPSASLVKASSRKPFGVLSPNVLCNMSGKSPVESSLNVKAKKNAPSATIHQGEEEGPLDIWAVVKPGNTKEKIAFFAAHQCSSRLGSMKIKSSWDIDGRATKRRKKSGDLKKAKIQLERMREMNGRCYQPEPFACGIEHCSVHCVSDSGDGVCAGRSLSVIQMVAFLEQRASALLASCAKTCTNAPAIVRLSGQSRGVSSAPDPFSAPGEEPTDRVGLEAGKPQSEPVRVLDMVARLESECLKRQSQREPGNLSRNNSFRRNVGRVLLTNGTQAEEGQRKRGTSEAPDAQVDSVQSLSVKGGPSTADHCSMGNQAWDGASQGCPSLPVCVSYHMDSEELEPGQQTAMNSSSSSRYDVEMMDELDGLPFSSPTCRQVTELPTDVISCMNRELVPLTSQNPEQRRKESLCVSITVSQVEKDHPPSLNSQEEPLPGMLFFLSPGQEQLEYAELNESTAQASSEASQLHDAESDHASQEKGVLTEPGPPASVVESTLPVLEASSSKKQVSQDFLETRFKIQQLLEPQQYMVCLPHHIMVKIFRLLPTRSLVALKCTCCYFKFIIEYYNIRPADSRWVRDPRYREDPCKQCKKKYVKGDVSLCRWHPKPYCQALPYGPGYWMCCHRSQKGFPGCKLGLHDNHWVPACHSFNRAIHKKARGSEAEEEY
uniref:F-box only protein 34 isoform X1 n=2 Tax=Jaculus jaculus TaxID=51337 RepID=UPI001E1B2D8C|nr:F-box only protein 34 isoform X1 [Jaculus jaculus]XP_045011005.1 F-box only protein 34 isoform X1 [Jaculus jaculus]